MRPLRLPRKAQDLGCLAAFADTGGGLDLFAAFWLLGGRSDQAFFPHPGLPGTTRRFRGATLARLVDFRGCTGRWRVGLFLGVRCRRLKANVDDSAFPSGWQRAVLMLRPLSNDWGISARWERSDEGDLEGQLA